jgi:F-type H+-transporting ATPase subunit gamma
LADWDHVQVKLIYNRFVSALSFEAAVMEVYDAEALKHAPNLAAYEIEDDELLKDLASFALANGIYAALVEGHAAEVDQLVMTNYGRCS